MKKLCAAFLFLFGLANAALAQSVTGPIPNSGVYGAYNTSPPTCVNGSGCWFQTDVNGQLKVTGTIVVVDPVLTATSSAALSANQIIIASPAGLYSFNVSVDSTLSVAAWWIMVYNATTAPVDGAVTPVKCYAMASGATSYSAAFPNPVPFSTGIVIGVSTTGCFTKTASTHAFISGDYK